MLKVPARALHVHACLPNTVGMLSVMDAVQLSKHSHLACAEQSQQIHWPLFPVQRNMLRTCVSMQL